MKRREKRTGNGGEDELESNGVFCSYNGDLTQIHHHVAAAICPFKCIYSIYDIVQVLLPPYTLKGYFTKMLLEKLLFCLFLGVS